MIQDFVSSVKEKLVGSPSTTTNGNGYCFMLDISGSVGGSQHYWNMISDLIALHGQQIDTYYFWDSSIEVTSKKEM